MLPPSWYAVSGADVGRAIYGVRVLRFATPSPVQMWSMKLSGTDAEYDTDVEYDCYAVSGTDVGYDATGGAGAVLGGA